MYTFYHTMIRDYTVRMAAIAEEFSYWLTVDNGEMQLCTTD